MELPSSKKFAIPIFLLSKFAWVDKSPKLTILMCSQSHFKRPVGLVAVAFAAVCDYHYVIRAWAYIRWWYAYSECARDR